MKRILFFAFMLICFTGMAQVPLGQGYNKSSLMYTYRAMGGDSALHAPYWLGTPSFRNGTYRGAGQLGVDSTNDRLYFSSHGVFNRVAKYSEINNSISALTAAAGTNSIDNMNYGQSWQWNSLGSGSGLSLSSSSTNAP